MTEIYRTLHEGIVRNGMASYNYLPPGDRFALIHFVRSFHPAPPADAESDVLMLETTYQLSKGSSIPAQIPDSRRHATGCRGRWTARPGRLRDGVARYG